jgi:hypothetical protein
MESEKMQCFGDVENATFEANRRRVVYFWELSGQ